MRAFVKQLGVSVLAVATVLGLVIAMERVAQAQNESLVKWLVLKATHGTTPTCTVATAAGSLCAAGDVEADDDLHIADDATINGDVTIGTAGTLAVNGTAATGSVVAGANTACNTTCTTSCLFGVNTAATEADIVACTDATADECVCLGAN